MILGNPFDEHVFHIGNCYFFKRKNLSSEFLMIVDIINLKLWERNKIVQIYQYNANDCFQPSGKFIKCCLNVIFIQTEAGLIQGNEKLV